MHRDACMYIYIYTHTIYSVYIEIYTHTVYKERKWPVDTKKHTKVQSYESH